MASMTPLFLLAFFLAITNFAAAGFTNDNFPTEKKTTLHFYYHEIFEGAPNATSYSIAHLPGRNTTSFGNIQVYDNRLTVGVDINSNLIGKAQGIAVRESMEDGSMLVVINYVFGKDFYNGSTLTTAGRVDTNTGHTEHLIIGGTGQFRLARGYALSDVNRAVSTDTYLVVEYTFYIIHY